MSRRYTAQEMRELADSDDFAAYLYDDPKRCPDPDFAEDDITPMVKDMLLQAADMMERERKYEYAERFARSGCVDYRHYDSKNEVEHGREMSSVVVRREVGDWKEVEG